MLVYPFTGSVRMETTEEQLPGSKRKRGASKQKRENGRFAPGIRFIPVADGIKPDKNTRANPKPIENNSFPKIKPPSGFTSVEEIELDKYETHKKKNAYTDDERDTVEMLANFVKYHWVKSF